MNRYWPLCITILAFVLGTELGAQGREELPNAKFNEIEVRRIKLSGALILSSFEGRRTLTLTSQGMDIVARERATPNRTATTHIDSQGVHLYETTETRGKRGIEKIKYKQMKLYT